MRIAGKRSLLALIVGAFASAAVPSVHAQETVQQRDLVLKNPKTPVPEGVPRGYALIVGIGAYKNLDAARQLRFSESDAEAMYRVLINHEGGSFPAENVHFLKGADATLANIRRELEEWLPSVAKPADRVVVYFAGHGFVNNGRGFLAPWDVDLAQIEQTAYPMSTLGDVLANRVKARWKVLLTDACHSGKITAETTEAALEREFDSLPTDFLTLTATTERDQSYEDPELSTGFGLFTYFVVQAWRGNADRAPCDGTITADELIEYVRSNVRRYARERQLSQTPTARGDYDPTMLLGVSRVCLAATADEAPTMGTAIVETNLDEVELYIDGALIGKIERARPLKVPQLNPGLHEFKGVKTGYEPDRKEVMIAPGQDATVTLRIRYARKIKPSAQSLNDQGAKLLFTRRSSINPMNVMPVKRTQTTGDLKEAHGLFERALADDPDYAEAAFNLGQVRQLLSDEDGSLAAYRRATEIDPGHVAARSQYAAVLIERGDADEAIRQLTEALRLDPRNDDVIALVARAYWDKGAWEKCVELADEAIAIKESNAQAQLWRADALRQLGAAEKDDVRQRTLYRQAREGYGRFLELTDYSTPAREWFAFHFIGFRLGSRRHADRLESYNNLRSAGFLGMCITERKVGSLTRARQYCERSLKYDGENAIAYFLLGNVDRDRYVREPSCGPLLGATASYRKMIALNPDLDQARGVRDYLKVFEQEASRLACKSR